MRSQFGLAPLNATATADAATINTVNKAYNDPNWDAYGDSTYPQKVIMQMCFILLMVGLAKTSAPVFKNGIMITQTVQQLSNQQK